MNAFDRWVASGLAGTDWTSATVREAADRPHDDLATAALADAFTAAAGGAVTNERSQR